MNTATTILPVGNAVLYENRNTWLADRRSAAPDYAFGATDCTAVLGRGYASPWEVYLGARGELPPKEDTPDLRRGRKWESRVREDYEEATGHLVSAPLCRVQSESHPWLRPSPDGFAYDGNLLEWGGLECKTDRHGDRWGEDGTIIDSWAGDAADLVPPAYAMQCYFLLAATRLPWWDIAVEIPSRADFVELRVLRLVADPSTQDELVGLVAEWRERHLVGGEEPPVDGSPALTAHLTRRFPGRGDKALRLASLDEVRLMDEYVALGHDIDAAEERRAILKNDLLGRLGDGYGLTRETDAKGARIIAVRSAGRRTISVGDVEKSSPELFDALNERGLVKTGAPSTSLRPYGFPK